MKVITSPKRAPRAWRWTIYGFAIIGFFSLLSSLLLFAQGHYWVSRFDPYFLPTMQEFVQQLVHNDLPQAVILRRPLAAEITWDVAQTALKQQAKQQNMPILVHYSLAAPETTEHQTAFQAEIYEFCDLEQSFPILSERPALITVFPCRLILFRASESAPSWILMPNIELFIRTGRPLPSAVKQQALKLHDQLFKIMMATVEAMPAQ